MKLELLLLGTAPCVSTLCLPDVTAHDQISQAFPLQTSIPITGGGNGLGTRLVRLHSDYSV